WCHGFKLHLACNDRGEIIAFVLTGANVSDKDPAVFDVLAKRLYGKLFADKGYISQKLFDSLFEEDIQLVTGLRVNMKNKLLPFYDKMMLRKRYIIETINDLLKNTAQVRKSVDSPPDMLTKRSSSHGTCFPIKSSTFASWQ
ncbi:transposase, partial [Prevotellaceae bacterium LCP21S3_C11]